MLSSSMTRASPFMAPLQSVGMAPDRPGGAAAKARTTCASRYQTCRSGGGLLLGDDLAREGEALAAARAAAERFIGAAWALRARTHGLTDVALPNRVADTDDHRCPLPDESDI